MCPHMCSENMANILVNAQQSSKLRYTKTISGSWNPKEVVEVLNLYRTLLLHSLLRTTCARMGDHKVALRHNCRLFSSFQGWFKTKLNAESLQNA